MGNKGSRPDVTSPDRGLVVVGDGKPIATTSAVQAAAQVNETFTKVSVVLPHKRLELDLPRESPRTPTVGWLHDEVARLEGVPRGLLTVHARGSEVYWNDEPLAPGVDYSVVAFPIFRELATITDDDDDEGNVLVPEPTYNIGTLPQPLRQLCAKKRAGVHFWRAHSQTERNWAELIVEGPAGSPYEGGAFLLRVEAKESEMMGCRYYHLTVRLITPLYHPTVGPNGQIAIWTEHTWGGNQPEKGIAATFRKQLESDVPPILHTSMKQIPQMEHMLKEWTALGSAGAAARARLWTWHYATPDGRAYRRSGGRCTGLTQLASLIKVDPQVQSEVRLTLLVANRHRAESQVGASEENTNLRPLAMLPSELLHTILLFVGSGRPQPQPADPAWQMAQYDDGLPLDWRACLPKTT